MRNFRGHDYEKNERRTWMDPEAVLKLTGLKAGDTFIDVGCGDGYFAIPAAKIAGEKGKVYGVDTNEEAVMRLEQKGKAEGLHNIILKTADAAETVFCQGCADIVFFGIDLHDFEKPDKVLNNAYGMLKTTGKFFDLDFKKIPMSFGPPLQIRFDEAEASRRIEAAGFKITSVLDFSPYNYLITAEKAK